MNEAVASVVQQLVLGNWRVGRIHTRIPPILRSRMVCSWTRLTSSCIQVLAVRSLGHCVVIPEETSFAELRNEQIDDIPERAWFDNVRLVEA